MRRGFTLVELIVVVAILGILSSIGIPLYRDHIENSKNAVVAANAKVVASYINSVLIRCSTGEKVITIQSDTGVSQGTIDCQAAGHHANISPMLTIFANHFSPILGKNPYNKSLPAIIVSGQSQPTGTIVLDYGRPDQCDQVRWCIRIGTYIKDGTTTLIYSDKW